MPMLLLMALEPSKGTAWSVVEIVVIAVAAVAESEYAHHTTTTRMNDNQRWLGRAVK